MLREPVNTVKARRETLGLKHLQGDPKPGRQSKQSDRAEQSSCSTADSDYDAHTRVMLDRSQDNIGNQ
jgi:hypothetical protein